MNSILAFLGENIQMIYIVILSVFVGVEVIGKVPSVLHTPLMSGANAIHGVAQYRTRGYPFVEPGFCCCCPRYPECCWWICCD